MPELNKKENIKKENLVLRVRGKEFQGWTAVTVQKSLYQMTGAFGLTSTDIFSKDFKKWNFSMGDECQVAINNQILITGYIEDILISYDAKNHNIQIAGRDKPGDLIDCSFVESAKKWDNQTIIKVIRDLCEPFNIDVEVDDSVSEQVSFKTPSKTFIVNEGETVFDSILRLSKASGILPVSYGNGKLVLTGTGTEKAYDHLELGKNIKSGSIDQTNRERFQTYIVRGQGKQQKGFFKSVESIAQSKGEYLDELINRYRPLVILSDTGGEAQDFQNQSEWECVTRAGKSRTIYYEVQGWTQSNGKVWPLNALVKIKDSFLGINEEWLIAAVNFSLNNDTGAMTELKIVRPDAFKLPLYNPTKEMKSVSDLDPLLDFQYHNL